MKTPFQLISKDSAVELLRDAGLMEKDLPTLIKEVYIVPSNLKVMLGGSVKIIGKTANSYYVRGPRN